MLWKLGLQVVAYALFILWKVTKCTESLFPCFKTENWSWKNLKTGILYSLATQCMVHGPGASASPGSLLETKNLRPQPRPTIRVCILTSAAGDLYEHQSLRNTVESTASAFLAIALLPYWRLNSAGSTYTPWISQFDAGGGVGFWCMPRLQDSHREEQVLSQWVTTRKVACWGRKPWGAVPLEWQLCFRTVSNEQLCSPMRGLREWWLHSSPMLG